MGNGARVYAGVTLFIVMLSASAYAGPVVFVRSDAAPGGNGASWDTAFISIQDGIDAVAAMGGGEVWIAHGTYSNEADPDTKAMLVMRDGVSLYGGFAGGERDRERANPAVNQTVLDASTALGGAPARYVLYGANDVVVDGLIIRNFSTRFYYSAMCFMFCSNVQVTCCMLEYLEVTPIYFFESQDITIERSWFRGNRVRCNYVLAYPGTKGDIVIQDCFFIENTPRYALITGGPAEARGRLRISNTLFLRNTTSGSSIVWTTPQESMCSVFFSQCWFAENIGSSIVHVDGLSFASISNTVFKDNAAQAIVFYDGSTLYPDDEFPEGDPPWYKVKDTVYFDICSVQQTCSNEIINCTFVGNDCDIVVLNGLQTVPIINSIFFQNDAIQAMNLCGLPVIGYSILEQPFSHIGEGNFVEGPGFISPGSLRLGANSPGIGTALDVSGPEHGNVTTDITGRPRGVYGAGYDMGAYQSGHAADLNADNRFNISELLRAIQFYNIGAYHCDLSSEDGYAPGVGLQYCAPHSSDYEPQDWIIGLNELLRLIQFWNSGGYSLCAESEDGFCPGRQ